LTLRHVDAAQQINKEGGGKAAPRKEDGECRPKLQTRTGELRKGCHYVSSGKKRLK